MLENAIAFLYSINILFSAFSYLPQIKLLITEKSNAESISIKTYLTWQYTLLVGLLYMVLMVHDNKAILAYAIMAVGNGIILLLVIFRRFRK